MAVIIAGGLKESKEKLMPYITEERRDNIEKAMENPNIGDINYVITMLLLDFLNKKGLNYENLNSLIGVLDCAKMELYRRVAIPYENMKIRENGDVYAVVKTEKDESSTH